MPNHVLRDIRMRLDFFCLVTEAACSISWQSSPSKLSVVRMCSMYAIQPPHQAVLVMPVMPFPPLSSPTRHSGSVVSMLRGHAPSQDPKRHDPKAIPDVRTALEPV